MYFRGKELRSCFITLKVSGICNLQGLKPTFIVIGLLTARLEAVPFRKLVMKQLLRVTKPCLTSHDVKNPAPSLMIMMACGMA